MNAVIAAGTGDIVRPVVPGTIATVMTTDVITAPPSTTFKELVQLIARHGVSALPVVDDQRRLVGIVSEADLLLKEKPERSSALVAEEVMTRHVISVQTDVPIARAARLMRQHRVKRLPVLNDAGALVGIVSRSDLLNHLSVDRHARRVARHTMFTCETRHRSGRALFSYPWRWMPTRS